MPDLCNRQLRAVSASALTKGDAMANAIFTVASIAVLGAAGVLCSPPTADADPGGLRSVTQTPKAVESSLLSHPARASSSCRTALFRTRCFQILRQWAGRVGDA